MLPFNKLYKRNHSGLHMDLRLGGEEVFKCKAELRKDRA